MRNYPTVPESALKGTARTNLDSPKPTTSQLERRNRSLVALKAKGLPYLASLPVVEDESSMDLSRVSWKKGDGVTSC